MQGLEEPRSESYFTAEEVKRLSDSIRSPLKEIILLAAHTSMRKSELLSLEWARVKPKDGYIEMTSRDQKSKKWGTVGLTDTAVQVFRSIPRMVGSPWIFPSPKDHSKPRIDFKRLWAKALKEAGLEPRPFKSLRHTTASHLAMDGVDLTTIKEVMRHLLEGTAMDCAGQVGVGIYPAKSSVYDTVARGVFCEPADFATEFDAEKGTAISCPIENKMAFFYSEFGCIVEFLRSSHGARRFQAFLKHVVAGPALNVDKSFETVFGTTLEREIARFKIETKKH